MSADVLALLGRGVLAISVGILIVLALRAPVRRAFGANVAYAFWLLVPIVTLAAFLPARRVFVEASTSAASTIAPIAETSGAAALARSGPLDAFAPTFDVAPIIAALWVFGFAVSLAALLFGQHRFVVRLGLRRGANGLHIAHADLVGPAVVGVVTPRIVVPADFEARYNANERALVLEHERAHIQAGDVQINALAAFLQCALWFNPLAYIARAKLRIDQEFACDERVMQRHDGARRAYAEAMLKTQLAARAVPLGCAWPPIGAQPLKQRIAMLARPKLGARRRALGGALCALATLTAGVAVWAAQPAQVAYADENDDERTLFSSAGARLVEALMSGDLEEARALIRAGANVNYVSHGDGTPLIVAARLDDPSMARLLLTRGADVNQPVRGDGNPLIVAAGRGDMALVEMFVAAGADVNSVVHGDETPLIQAAWNGHVEAARYLIEHGADVNLAVDAPTRRGTERRSPLIMATRGNHADMVALLRQAGARN